MMELLLMLLGCGVMTLRLGSGGGFPKPLKPEEEERYVRLWAEQGDENARNVLIERNLRLVAHVMKKYYTTGEDMDDLLSIGTIGLIKGVNTYRRDKNIKLATYASRCIENEILMYIRKTANQKTEVSLDEPINMDCEGNELVLSDILGTDENVVTGKLEEAVDLQLLHQALSQLPQREREIINMRFGLAGCKERTQKEVAEYLGISQSYISRLEKKIMQKLRKELIKMTNCA
jgi:RNA polymerase sporulation-specific sigma factor